MFLIMGIQDKTKAELHSNALPCHVCDGDRGFELYNKYNYFHIFFLPVWTWGHSFSVKCSRCGSFYYVKEESQLKAKNSEVNFTYWDLEPANIHQHGSVQKKCSQCGFDLEDDFEFCPKCGTSVENQ